MREVFRVGFDAAMALGAGTVLGMAVVLAIEVAT